MQPLADMKLLSNILKTARNYCHWQEIPVAGDLKVCLPSLQIPPEHSHKAWYSSRDLGYFILKLSLQVFYLSLITFPPPSRSGQAPKKLQGKAGVCVLQGAAAGVVSEGDQDLEVLPLK